MIGDFKSRRLYSFLQYSYYQIGDLSSALEAAEINLKYNPDSTMMQDNVKFYNKKVKNRANMLLHEQPDSLDNFSSGVDSYMKSDYDAATLHFNSSLNCKLTIVEVHRLIAIS